MSHVVTIHFEQQELQAVIVRSKGAASGVEAVVTIPYEDSLEPAAVAQLLHDAIRPYVSGKTKVIATVNRMASKWQYLTLPPCSVDDLPDLVRMQIDLDAARSEEVTGYDLLPLTGNEENPHHLLAVTLDATLQSRIRKICRSADLDLVHIVPVATGWPAFIRLLDDMPDGPCICLVLDDGHSTLWASDGDQLNLFRQVHLPSAEFEEEFVAAVYSQLRRTLLALSQEGHPTTGTSIGIFGENTQQVSELISVLNEKLDSTVFALDPPTELVTTQHTGSLPFSNLPLVGLAKEGAAGTRPLLDFLHPRQSPPPRSNVRTYVIAAAVAIMVLGAVLWQGYQTLQAPLREAAVAEAELSNMQELLDELSEVEQQVASIQDWLASDPHLLTELSVLSKSLRPTALSDEDFSAEQDIVLKRLEVKETNIMLNGNVTSSGAVHPLEERLRNESYRVRREASEPQLDEEQYPWRVRIVVEPSDTANEGSEQQ